MSVKISLVPEAGDLAVYGSQGKLYYIVRVSSGLQSYDVIDLTPFIEKKKTLAYLEDNLATWNTYNIRTYERIAPVFFTIDKSVPIHPGNLKVKWEEITTEQNGQTSK